MSRETMIVDPDEIQDAIERAHKMRSQYVASYVAGAWAWIKERASRVVSIFEIPRTEQL